MAESSASPFQQHASQWETPAHEMAAMTDQFLGRLLMGRGNWGEQKEAGENKGSKWQSDSTGILPFFLEGGSLSC